MVTSPASFDARATPIQNPADTARVTRARQRYPPRTPSPSPSPSPTVAVRRSQPLSPRETEILRLLADGLGNKGIGRRLGISEHTVKAHVSAILGKLGAASRAEAVAAGARLGVLLL